MRMIQNEYGSWFTPEQVEEDKRRENGGKWALLVICAILPAFVSLMVLFGWARG